MDQSREDNRDPATERSRLTSSFLLLLLGLGLGWFSRSCVPSQTLESRQEQPKNSPVVAAVSPTPTPTVEATFTPEIQELTLRAPIPPPPEPATPQKNPAQTPASQPLVPQNAPKVQNPPTAPDSPKTATRPQPPAPVPPLPAAEVGSAPTSPKVQPQPKPKPRKTAAPLRIPEPDYPVYQVERIPRGEQPYQGSGAGLSRADGGGWSTEETRPPEPDEPARLIYYPEVFIRGSSTIPYAVAEFEIFPDGSFYVGLLQGMARADYDAMIIDTLRDWEWEPARRNGESVATVEQVRIRKVTLGFEEWERRRAIQHQARQQRRR